MKKLIAAILAVLCLAGCSAKEEKTDVVGVTVMPQQETVEAPVESIEPPVQEFEIEITEGQTEEPAVGEGSSVAVPVELVEGLVGDAVGYSFQQPVFTEYAASEAMNAFYADLIEGLVAYGQGGVNDECLKNNCVASVFGKVLHATLTGDLLAVEYECRADYSGDHADAVNVRVDTWNVQTGEVTSDVG